MKQIKKFGCLNCKNTISIKDVEEKVIITTCSSCECKMRVKKIQNGLNIKVIDRKKADFDNKYKQLRMEC